MLLILEDHESAIILHHSRSIAKLISTGRYDIIYIIIVDQLLHHISPLLTLQLNAANYAMGLQ